MRIPLVAALFAALLFWTGCDSSDPDDGLDGESTVTGSIRDSQQAQPVVGATVAFQRGNAERTTTTGEDGTFTITNLAIGTYRVVVRADGFLQVTLDNIVVGEGVNELPPTIAPEAPPEGAYRIVLSWGQQPRDLDSHLTGPRADGGRFHVYFSSRNPVPYASLDRDITDSFGPETITITPQVNGMYRYSVFNFSNQSTEGSQGIAGTISNSTRARVQVYSSTQLVREYLAPAATPGNAWRVFEMNVNGSSVTFNDINQYVTATGSGDTNSFRPEPKTATAVASVLH